MLIEHFHNAACIVTSNGGQRVLCDPWFNDGVFLGSWCLATELHRVPQPYDDFDAVYVSHVHPDHFDEAFLAGLPRSVPLVVPAEAIVPILAPKLRAAGFTDVRALQDRQQTTFGDLTLTLFEPFQRNPFDDHAELPNFLDSALLFDDGHHRFLNTNDNLPTPEALRLIDAQFGTPHVTTLLYNSAGFYPQCVDDLSEEEKRTESGRVLQRALDACLELAKASRSEAVVPFAGDYALGGRLASLNEYLPVSTPHLAAEFLRDNGCPSLAFGTGGVYSVGDRSLDVEGKAYTIADAISRAGSLATHYPYELEAYPDLAQLEADLHDAAVGLRAKQNRLGVFPDYAVEFVGLDGQPLGSVSTAREHATHTVTCRLDARLLAGILERRYHWDNAQIGCHLSFSRSNHPDYSSDLHFILSLLHR